VNLGKVILRAAVFVGVLLLGPAAFANPVRCSPGYQDSTCTPALANAPQPQPQCPASAGWTTSVASQWIGSQWSAPSCNYQVPPTCQPGYTETSAPVWNGSSWSAPGCQPPSQPQQTPGQLCTSAAATGNLTTFAVGYGWHTANASQFTKYQDFSQWYKVDPEFETVV